jgi:alanyl-tRNA synthetase
VRVITVPDAREESGFFSKELCGGTHVRHTGQIGVLKVVSEASSAAGVRRVEAITGAGALESYQRALATLRQLAGTLRAGEDELVEATERLLQHSKQLERQLQKARRDEATARIRGADEEINERTRKVKDEVKVLSWEAPLLNREGLREQADRFRQKLGSGVVVLGSVENGNVILIAAVTKDLTTRLHAGKIVKEVAERVGGKGGGRADMAEAGGNQPALLREALEAVYAIVERML